MGAHSRKQCGALAGGFQALPEQGGNQVLNHSGPGAVDPFAAVEGIFADNAFSPAIDALAVNGNQENAAAVKAVEARLEEVDERHVNFAERDGFDLHCESG